MKTNLVAILIVGVLIFSLVAFNFQVQANGSKHHHGGTPDSKGSSGSKGISPINAITSDSDVGVIPGVAPNQDITVGTTLQGCYGVVSNPSNPSAADTKPNCDLVVGYVVNYCLDHMNDTMAKENKQVCWDHSVMEEGLRYAVAYLDGGTGRMVKAQSDIMTTINKAYTALPKETLINLCATTTGITPNQEMRNVMLNESLKQLVDCASGTPLNK